MGVPQYGHERVSEDEVKALLAQEGWET